ncbi:unnamed protein product [Pedinophyceae sp. YPF-701]|nr:unnamed protein product [Pedinophyceae sp. YPF-701]
MGFLFLEDLDHEEEDTYGCKCCLAHLARRSDVYSRLFHSCSGKAYLFKGVCNVLEGPSVDRRMTTGVHTVCDVYCARCMELVGWRYLKAHEESQQYKEGKVILERAKIADAAERRAASLASAGASSLGSGHSDSGGSEAGCP